MSKDIYGSESKIAGAWNIDEAVLTIEGGEDLIATGFSMNYGRTVTPFTPINRQGKFLLGGQGRGDITVTALVGPTKAIKDFIARYADICNAPQNTITVKPAGIKNCSDPGGQTIEFIASGCALTTLSIDITQLGGISVVNSRLTLVINNLEIK